MRLSMYRIYAVSGLALLWGGSQRANAQQPEAGTAAVIVAAIQEIRGRFPGNPAAFGVAASVELSREHKMEIAKAAGIPEGDLKTAQVCTAPSPSACNLVGVVVFVSVVRASVAERSGDVTLEIREQTSNARQPIHATAFHMMLVRSTRAAPWKVASVVALSES